MKKLIFILLTSFTIVHAMQEISRKPKNTKSNVPLTKLAVKEATNALLEIYKKNPGSAISELYERDPNRISYLNDELAHLLKEEVCLRLNKPLKVFKSTNRLKIYPQFTDDGELMVIAFDDKDKSVQLWSAKTGKLLRAFNHDCNLCLTRLSPDGKLLAITASDRTVKVWKIETEELLQTFQYNGYATSVQFSPDSKLLVITASKDGAKVWDVEMGALLQTFENISNFDINLAQLSPDGTLLATATQHTYGIKLWNAKTGKALLGLLYSSGRATSIQFSPNGKLLLVTLADGRAILWDITTRNRLKMFEHRDMVCSGQFSYDNKLIVTASKDNTAKIWDVETGKCLQTFSHRGQAYCAQFSPDGKLLVIASGDEVKLWYMKPKAIKDSLELLASSGY